MHLAHDPRQPIEPVKTTPSRQEAEENVERPGKRRKLGIAETILSTAVSVAIVSTAVGYTAYRLWRDGGSTSSAVGAQNDETGGVEIVKKDPDNDWKEWKDRAARRGISSQTASGLSSPPPPYYATYEDSWLGDGEREGGGPSAHARGGAWASTVTGGGSGGRYLLQQDSTSRPGSKRGPMAKVHRTLRTTGSPRSDGRRVGKHQEDEGVSGKRGSHGSLRMERNERVTSPTGRKLDGWRAVEEDVTSKKTGTGVHHKRELSRSVAMTRLDSDEEGEEGSNRLDEQMDWMSERLRGLIADGKRALGREVVVAEGMAGSPSLSDVDGDGAGHVDDEEAGWEDEDKVDIDATSYRSGRGVAGYTGSYGRQLSRRASPRRWSTLQ